MIRIGCAFSFLLLTSCATAQSASGAKSGSLGWLVGCWETRSAQGRTVERWASPVAGTMMGTNVAAKNGKRVFFEFIRIEEVKDGETVYLAQPKGRSPATEFRLTKANGTEATFENPKHDFPQRIHYERRRDALIATVSTIDGATSSNWTFSRFDCAE